MVNVWPRPRPSGAYDSFAYEDTKEEEREVAELKKKLTKLKIVARAKVTMNRVYCAQYHPEKSKDLIFFGGSIFWFRPILSTDSADSRTDKHGQLGIWDPKAPPDEVGDDEEADPEVEEGGKYWRLQVHWPATSRSSISCVRFDPTNSHSASRPIHTLYRPQLTRLSYYRSTRALMTARFGASQWALESAKRSSPRGMFSSIPLTLTPRGLSCGFPMLQEGSHTLIREWTDPRPSGMVFQGRRWGASA